MKFAEIVLVASLAALIAVGIIGLILHANENSDDDSATVYKNVTIADGKIRGRLLITEKNNTYYGFQDIPYAKPPVGSLRLKEAVPPEKWTGVLDTLGNSKICYQFQAGHSDSRENEDCLVLNVYTTVDPDNITEKLPVFVWIHGGTFVEYSGAADTCGPSYYMDQNVIVVTLNYRLGPLGFLSTDDGVVPANLGLKDQHLALKWINKNIDKFGGDPTKVTIGGQSAGAASVGYHVLNKKSEGLFRSAIMESGSPLNCWSFKKNAKNVAQLLAKALSSNSEKSFTSQEILSLIQSADLKQLKEIVADIQTKQYTYTNISNCHQYTSSLFTPVVEDENDENAFVTGMNYEKVKSGDINQVPILIGINSQESLLFPIQALLLQSTLFDSDLSAIITVDLNMKDENKETAGQSLRKLYTNSTFGSDQPSSLMFFSDCIFTTAIASFAALQSQYTDVYFYQFSYRGTLGRLVDNDMGVAAGVAHGEELGFFWHQAKGSDLSTYPQEDILVHERAMLLWAQFIKYQNPTAEKSETLSDIKWSKVTQDDFPYLDIDSELTLKNHPKNYKEFNEIYSTYGEAKFDTY